MKIVGDTPKIVSANPARVHLIHHLSNSRSFQNTKHVIRFPPRGSSFIRHKKKKKDSPILFIYSMNFNGAAGDT